LVINCGDFALVLWVFEIYEFALVFWVFEIYEFALKS